LAFEYFETKIVKPIF